MAHRIDLLVRCGLVYAGSPIVWALHRPLVDARRPVRFLTMGAPQAAPTPILGALDQFRAQGIAFDVAANGQEMGVVLYDERLEAALI